MTYRAAREAFERGYWMVVLCRAKGRIVEMARISGCHRATVYDRLNDLKIPYRTGRYGNRGQWHNELKERPNDRASHRRGPRHPKRGW